jgi:hypothetical protein
MARYDDLNTTMIAYGTVLSIVVLVIVLQGTQALTYNMVNSEDSLKSRTATDTASVVKSEQIKALSGYKKAQVPDEASQTGGTKEVLMIPIEDAKQIVLKEFSKK